MGNRALWVIDGTFDQGFQAMMHAYLARLPFYRNDVESRKYNRYRHLKHEFDIATLEENPLLRSLLRTVFRHVDDKYGNFAPNLVRAYVNDIPHGDMQNPHMDTVPGVTALYYANAEWAVEWHGETIFYEGEEAVAAISPLPGRIVIFPADIMHRAGTPSRECPPTRLSFAFNFSTSSQPG